MQSYVNIGRYMRHFNCIGFTTFDDQSMQQIFQTILDWWLRKEEFPPEYLSHAQVAIGTS